MADKRLLVIGGTGFIGGSLCEAAVNADYKVYSLSLNSPKANIKNVNYIQADITDNQAISKSISGLQFEYVVNCGGYIDHTLFKSGGRRLLNEHFDAVQNLIENLDRSHLKRFVQIGSSDEYGNLPAPQKESSRESSISPYSLAKVATTQFLQMLWKTEQFPAVVLRLFLTYGPGQDFKRFIPQIIKGCLNDDTFPASEGKQFRDFCFVEDTVDAIFKSFENDKVNGEILNIASGEPVAIKDMVATIQKLTGKGTPEYGKIPYRPGENMELFADTAKAGKLLGWEPATSLEQGLEKTVEYYQKLL